MYTSFLTSLIEKYVSPDIDIYITDTNARILVSNLEERIGTIGNTAKYVITTKQCATIQSHSIIYYGIPVELQNNLKYIIVTKGNLTESSEIGNLLCKIIESTLEYEHLTETQNSNGINRLNQIASMLLSDNLEVNKVIPIMYQCELNPDLLRSVIFIHLDFHQNTYFNINLSLGYEASIEQLRQEVKKELSQCKFLNGQDLFYEQNRNTLVIIKSFLPTSDISKIYSAMEEICKNINSILQNFQGFSFSIAYGGVFHNLSKLHISLEEASTISELGTMHGKQTFCNLKNLIFDYTTNHMPPLVINQIILPILQKLTTESGEIQRVLIENAEAYVDSCMNLTTAAESLNVHRNTVTTRLTKFESITGLFPSRNFRDAFLVKLAATYLKQKDYKNQEEKR